MYTLCCTVQNVATPDTFPVDMQHLTDTVKLSILVHPYFHLSFFLELKVSKNKEKMSLAKKVLGSGGNALQHDLKPSQRLHHLI